MTATRVAIGAACEQTYLGEGPEPRHGIEIAIGSFLDRGSVEGLQKRVGERVHDDHPNAGSVMIPLYRFTHLGRPIDLSTATVRWAVWLTLGGAVAGLIRPGDRTPTAAAFQTALTVFLAWALARELAPDHPTAAVLAGVMAGAATTWTGQTNVAALAAFMLAGRISTRTTGLTPLLTDVLAVGVFAGVFARTPLSWAAGLAIAAAVAFDSWLPDPAPQTHVWLAAAIGVAVTITTVLSDALPRAWVMPDTATLILAAVGLLALAAAPRLTLRSVTDDGARPLDSTRLGASRRIVLVAMVLGTALGGGVFAHQTWPVWLTAVAVGATARREA